MMINIIKTIIIITTTTANGCQHMISDNVLLQVGRCDGDNDYDEDHDDDNDEDHDHHDHNHHHHHHHRQWLSTHD